MHSEYPIIKFKVNGSFLSDAQLFRLFRGGNYSPLARMAGRVQARVRMDSPRCGGDNRA